jgi:hypothetical protein
VPGDEDANDVPQIQVNSLFNFAGHSYQVVLVEDDQIRAIRFGARNRIAVVFHNKNKVAAAIALKDAVEDE